MKKLMIAAVAGVLALSACNSTQEYNSTNTVVENVNEPDTNMVGPCNDGSFPEENQHCK